jgi:hypothetical protein
MACCAKNGSYLSAEFYYSHLGGWIDMTAIQMA